MLKGKFNVNANKTASVGSCTVGRERFTILLRSWAASECFGDYDLHAGGSPGLPSPTEGRDVALLLLALLSIPAELVFRCSTHALVLSQAGHPAAGALLMRGAQGFSLKVRAT